MTSAYLGHSFVLQLFPCMMMAVGVFVDVVMMVVGMRDRMGVGV